jgi:hypothetical protein
MKYIHLLILSISMMSAGAALFAVCNDPWAKSKCATNGCAKSCPFSCCKYPPCGPYPRPTPGDYESFKDNTKIIFTHKKPCGPRNDSKWRGYLYKGIWWDETGVRYWAIRNSTNNTITVEGLEGGEIKDIPAGDVVNIARGESYAFRVQSPARRFELFNSDMHHIEIFINLNGDIDYRVEPTLKPVKTAKGGQIDQFTPNF